MIFFVALLAFVSACAHASSEGIYRNLMRRQSYDYIIVGSGTSGAIIANRLTEDENVSVLLLEAGGLPTGQTEVPLLGIYLLGQELDWTYYTEPQEQACLAMNNKQAFIPRGKAVGGSTTINSMLYVRGDKRDFDEWAKGGAAGWSWDDVFYYFKKLENYEGSEFSTNGLHGTDGPQRVSLIEHGTELRDAILGAGKEAGYDVMDLNAESLSGFAKVQGTTYRGRRFGTEKGYLRPAAYRENLDILYNAHVTKVLFDQNKRAIAVRFEQNQASHVVRTNKEIVMSAGVFGTPQILLLSGVGPKAHLEELGIPVIADLPVGENLQDHVMTASQAYKINSSIGLFHQRVVNPRTIGEFLEGRGPLTVPLTVEAIAAMNTKYQDPSEQWPDVRLFFMANLILPAVGEEGKVQQVADHEGFTVDPMVARPKSIGVVKLRSTNPYDPPIIDPRYLSDEYDVKVLVEGMKITERIVQMPSLAKYNPQRTPEVVAGCEKMDTTSDEYLACAARQLTITGYHQCCTAKMGRADDPTTVVDSELRVKGVSGLRIADASIMPAVTSGNTMAPCLMIGEKAADLIRGRYWDPSKNTLVTKDE